MTDEGAKALRAEQAESAKRTPTGSMRAWAIVLLFALLSYQPATVLFGMFVAYALSGYIVSAWLEFRRRRAGRHPGTVP